MEENAALRNWTDTEEEKDDGWDGKNSSYSRESLWDKD